LFGIWVIIVIFGSFRIDFVVRNLDKFEYFMFEYFGISGKFAALLRTINGKQPGDPAKAAQALLKLAAMEAPPLRLYLGKYAFGMAKQRLSQTQAELDASAPIGLDTDF